MITESLGLMPVDQIKTDYNETELREIIWENIQTVKSILGLPVNRYLNAPPKDPAPESEVDEEGLQLRKRDPEAGPQKPRGPPPRLARPEGVDRPRRDPRKVCKNPSKRRSW